MKKECNKEIKIKVQNLKKKKREKKVAKDDDDGFMTATKMRCRCQNKLNHTDTFLLPSFPFRFSMFLSLIFFFLIFFRFFFLLFFFCLHGLVFSSDSSIYRYTNE